MSEMITQTCGKNTPHMGASIRNICGLVAIVYNQLINMYSIGCV